jgi:hypothetical protein
MSFLQDFQNIKYLVPFTGIVFSYLNPILLPFFGWCVLLCVLSLVCDYFTAKIKSFYENLSDQNPKYKIFAKLGLVNLYTVITLLTRFLVLSIIVFSIIVTLFGAWLTSLQMLMLSLLISFAVLKLTNYIHDLKFDAKGLKDNAFYLSVAGLIFLLNFMPIITLLDKVVVTIAVLAVVGSFIDNHPRQDNKTFTILVKFLVVASNTIVCSILLGGVFPNAAFVFVGLLSAVFSMFCLKEYLLNDKIKDEKISSQPFKVDKCAGAKDDEALSELASVFNNLSIIYELFLLLWEPIVALLVGPYPLISFIGYLALAACICVDTFNFAALLGKPEGYTSKVDLVKDSLFLLGNDVADFFKKISTWSLILASFAMPGYVRLGLVGLCVAISLLASISKQLASINKKLIGVLRDATLIAEGNRAKRSKYITYILFVISAGLWFAGLFNVIWFVLSVVSVVCLIIDNEYKDKGVLKASIASFTLCSVIAAHGYAIHLLCSYFGVFGYLIKGIMPISLLLGLGVALLLNQDLIKQKISSLEGLDFKNTAPWFFGMLKNITGCFRILLPYFGISNSAIMMLFMTCSPWVKIMLAFVCGISSLFEGYLFLTHVLFVPEKKKPNKTKDKDKLAAAVMFNVAALVILLFMKPAFCYVAIFGFIISIIDYNKLKNKGFRDIVKFLAIGLNFVLVFLVCKTLLSLYVTATIVDGTIALSSVIGLILAGVLNFYYAKNQLGSMQTNLANILLARCSGLLLFVSFLFRCGGTYCVVILALNNIPFIITGSIVYNVLAIVITMSFMAQYVVNIVRAYIQQANILLPVKDKGDAGGCGSDGLNQTIVTAHTVDGLDSPPPTHTQLSRLDN